MAARLTSPQNYDELPYSSYGLLKQKLGDEALPKNNFVVQAKQALDRISKIANLTALYALLNNDTFLLLGSLITLGSNYLIYNQLKKSHQLELMNQGLKEFASGNLDTEAIWKIFQDALYNNDFENTTIEVNRTVYSIFYQLSLLKLHDELKEVKEFSKTRIQTNKTLVNLFVLNALCGQTENKEVKSLRENIENNYLFFNTAIISIDHIPLLHSYNPRKFLENSKLIHRTNRIKFITK